MKRIVAAAVTGLIIAGLLVTAAVRPRGTAPSETPEQCLETMFQAMKSGNVPEYLACFTGELREQLQRTARDQPSEAFSDYLKQTAAPIKGRAIQIDKTQQSADGWVRIVVDRVYEQRQWEYQGYRLRRESAGWNIYAIDPAEMHDPLVPYGTPAFPTEDTAAETGSSDATAR